MKLNQEIPKLSGTSHVLNGEVTREELMTNDRPTFILIWSVSCPSCKEHMDKIVEFLETIEDKVDIVTIHRPRQEEDKVIDTIVSEADEYGLKYSILVDNNLRVVENFNMNTMPEFYLFNRKGELIHYQTDATKFKILDKRIELMNK